MKKESTKLTPKQALFCSEYTKDCNATQAAIRSGYSKNRASELGYQLLHKTTVQRRIEILQKQAAMKAEISRDEVISILADIIRADAPELFKDGKLKQFSELTAREKKSIESIKLAAKGRTEIKMYSKLAAIERLNKMLGWDSPEKTETELTIVWEEKRNGTVKEAN